VHDEALTVDFSTRNISTALQIHGQWSAPTDLKRVIVMDCSPSPKQIVQFTDADWAGVCSDCKHPLVLRLQETRVCRVMLLAKNGTRIDAVGIDNCTCNRTSYCKADNMCVGLPTTPPSCDLPLETTLPRSDLATKTAKCGGATKVKLAVKVNSPRLEVLVWSSKDLEEIKVCLGPQNCRNTGTSISSFTRALCTEEWHYQDGVAFRDVPAGVHELSISFPELQPENQPCDEELIFGLSWDVEPAFSSTRLVVVLICLGSFNVVIFHVWKRRQAQLTQLADWARAIIASACALVCRLAVAAAAKIQLRRVRQISSERADDDDDDEADRCRICYSTAPALVSPCQCRGSLAHVHEDCLRKWMAHAVNASSLTRCDLCHADYTVSLAPNRCALTAIKARRLIVRGLKRLFVHACAIYCLLQVLVFGVAVLSCEPNHLNEYTGHRWFATAKICTLQFGYFSCLWAMTSRGWYTPVWTFPVSVPGAVLTVTCTLYATTVIKIILWQALDFPWTSGDPVFAEQLVLWMFAFLYMAAVLQALLPVCFPRAPARQPRAGVVVVAGDGNEPAAAEGQPPGDAALEVVMEEEGGGAALVDPYVGTGEAPDPRYVVDLVVVGSRAAHQGAAAVDDNAFNPVDDNGFNPPDRGAAAQPVFLDKVCYPPVASDLGAAAPTAPAPQTAFLDPGVCDAEVTVHLVDNGFYPPPASSAATPGRAPPFITGPETNAVDNDIYPPLAASGGTLFGPGRSDVESASAIGRANSPTATVRIPDTLLPLDFRSEAFL